MPFFMFQIIESDAGVWLDKVGFGSIINYRVQDNKIIATVEGQVSPAGFPVTAVVEYGSDLKVKNIMIVDTEEK